MSEVLSHANTRFRRLTKQLRYLPRTLAIVRNACGRLTTTWAMLLVLQGLLPIVTVFLTRGLVNSLLAAVRSQGNWTATQSVVRFAIWIGVVMLAQQLARTAAAWLRAAQAELVKDHISSLIQNKSLAVDLSFYDSSESYDHLHRARLEATYRPVELLEGLGAMLQGTVTGVAILLVLLPFGVLVPLALLLSATPALYLLLQMAHRRHRWSQRTTEDQRRSWYYDSLLTEAENAGEVRAFTLGEHFSAAFREIRSRLRTERLSLAREENIAGLWAGTASLLVLAAVMVWMTWRTIEGSLSLGDLAMFYQAFNQSLGISRSLLENLSKLYENSLFLGNLFEFLDLQPTIASPTDSRHIQAPLRGGLRFEGVSFRYPDTDRLTLRDFNLVVRPGQTVALVGPNGSGKSTVMKLLLRFYDPEAGRISIDGIPLAELSPDELRRNISAFFQDPIHYNDTAGNNIRFGDLQAILAQAPFDQAAEFADLDPILARLPNGWNSRVGRAFLDGTELSIGEWQRLALARALFRQCPILMLDEPTSAMDPWTERRWVERLREWTADRITLLITHRFTTAMLADEIHVISGGTIVESGTHEQLLARGGLYAEGWSSQARSVRA